MTISQESNTRLSFYHFVVISQFRKATFQIFKFVCGRYLWCMDACKCTHGYMCPCGSEKLMSGVFIVIHLIFSKLIIYFLTLIIGGGTYAMAYMWRSHLLFGEACML